MTTERYNYKTRLKTLHISIAREASGRAIDGPDRAVATTRTILADLDPDQEHFLVLALNAAGKVNGYRVVASGTLTSCIVHPREVFRAAIMLGAASIIVAHNHPSGDPAPSSEDRALTDRLIEAGKLLGIPVHDSLVIGSTQRWASICHDIASA